MYLYFAPYIIMYYQFFFVVLDEVDDRSNGDSGASSLPYHKLRNKKNIPTKKFKKNIFLLYIMCYQYVQYCKYKI
jgi:hypothetical protein